MDCLQVPVILAPLPICISHMKEFCGCPSWILGSKRLILLHLFYRYIASDKELLDRLFSSSTLQKNFSLPSWQLIIDRQHLKVWRKPLDSDYLYEYKGQSNTLYMWIGVFDFGLLLVPVPFLPPPKKKKKIRVSSGHPGWTLGNQEELRIFCRSNFRQKPLLKKKLKLWKVNMFFFYSMVNYFMMSWMFTLMIGNCSRAFLGFSLGGRPSWSKGFCHSFGIFNVV